MDTPQVDMSWWGEVGGNRPVPVDASVTQDINHELDLYLQ